MANKTKKGRKYSNGAKRVQVLERGVSNGGQRLALAVEIGLTNWNRRRNKSAKKRRDGAVRDALQNATFAAGRALREASWAPSDMISTLGPERSPRRALARALLPFWR